MSNPYAQQLTMHARVPDSVQLEPGFDLHRYLTSQAEFEAVRRFGGGATVALLNCCISDDYAPIYAHASLVVLSKWQVTRAADGS